MHIIALVPYILQLLLIIHIVKNGKSYMWLWIMFFLPYVGGLAYIIVEILPSFNIGGMVRKASDTITDSVFPEKKIKELEDLLKRQNTVSNKVLLANALTENKNYEKAIELYNSCLEGPFLEDESIMILLAKAYFLNGNVENAKTIMDKLDESPLMNAFENQLLNIQIHGEDEKLFELYNRTSSLEAGYYCIDYCIKNGQKEKALEIFDSMKSNVKNYKSLKKTIGMSWYNKAKNLLK